MNRYKVAIIIPIFNKIKYTLKCIDSIKNNNYNNYQIIIVDDGSTDNSKDILLNKYGDVKVLDGDGNLWWGGSVNLGIKYALKNNFDYVLLLNNDNIVDNNFLINLLDLASKNKKLIVGSVVLYNNSNIIKSSGVKINWLKGKFNLVDRNQKYNKKYKCKSFFEVDTLGGQGVLIPIQVFKEIGMIDNKNFPQYTGDTDFYLKAKKNDFKIVIQPKSIVWDDVSSTGLIKINRRLSFINFLKSFNSIKSHMSFKTTFRLFIRHCPKHLFLISYFLFYSRYILRYLRGKV